VFPSEGNRLERSEIQIHQTGAQMFRSFLGITLAIAVCNVMAATDPQCAEYEKLRSERDKALKEKDAKRYCSALSGLIKLYPATQADRAKLKCEAVTTNGNVDAWTKMRPDVITMMKATYSQQCK
jgi:hypothetical protein